MCFYIMGFYFLIVSGERSAITNYPRLFEDKMHYFFGGGKVLVLFLNNFSEAKGIIIVYYLFG